MSEMIVGEVWWCKIRTQKTCFAGGSHNLRKAGRAYQQEAVDVYQ
jgi:hypothetical protein